MKAGAYGTVSWGNSDTYGTSWDSPITYQSDPAGASYSASIIQITINRTSAANPNSYLIFSGIDVNVPGEHATAYGIGIINANQVKVLNSRVRGVWGGGSGENPSLVFVRGSSDILIQNCEVYNGGASGIEIWGSQNITVRNCLVHDITDSGIRLGGYKGQGNYVIEYNRVYTSHGDWGHDPGHQGGSGLSIRTDYATIRGNIVWDGWGTRLIMVYPKTLPDWSIDPNGWHDLTFENNITYQGLNWTEFTGVNQNWVIRNNTFGESVTIVLAGNSNGSGLTLYNNVFAGGLQLNSYSNTLSSPRDQNWINVNEGRNIYSGLASKGQGYLWYYDEFKPGSDSISIRNANNNYKPGYDSTYFDIGKFFVSKSGEWPYKLYETSPAIDFANKNYAPTTDILSNPRDSQPDAGAYEFQGTAPQQCLGTDTSCGIWPNCANCNLQDSCIADSNRNYYCSGTRCTYTEDNCTDCTCNCGDYNATESIANNNCSDAKDNDCDTKTDTADEECQTAECTVDSDCPTGQTCQNSACAAECIDNTKLTGFIGQWKQGNITMLALMQKMKQWKAGTGCPS